MSVTSVQKDFDNLTIILIADFDASIDRVWQLWADPRQLERWWGPPGYPATMQEHDLTPGGRVTYHMTSPEGEKHFGYWRVLSVDAPKTLEFEDGFADQDGKPNTKLPAPKVNMRLIEHNGGTRMEMNSLFDTRENMEQVVNMGAVEGVKLSVGQMDSLLAD
jgi:uncharacterized protein YndB with AHSA1/START domain